MVRDGMIITIVVNLGSGKAWVRSHATAITDER